MANDALNVNPPNADYHLTTGGSDWLWAVFALFTLSLLIVVGWTFARPRGTRLFHHIVTVVLLTGAISYFSMASDLGATPVPVEFRGNGTRQIWFVRYIQWFITFPLILLELLLVTGLSLSDILTTMFMGIVLVVTGLVAALVRTRYKWGYYTFGLFALFYIWHGSLTTFSAGVIIRSRYRFSATYLSFLLLLYPIAWACAEGANVISVTSEMIWYGILDILAGPVFLLFFLFRLRGIDYATFGLHAGKYTEYAGAGARGDGALPATSGTAPTTTTGGAAPATYPTNGATNRV